MNTELISIGNVVFQMLVLLSVIVMAISRVHASRNSIVMVFFIYGVICFFLSDSYWLVHIILRGEARIPFGVNEIGEIGVFLLFASMLDSVIKHCKSSGRTVFRICMAALYSASCIALWIGWTGEWIKDILSGIAFAYFICTAIRALSVTGALNRIEWHILGCASFVLIVLQGLIFILPAPVGKAVDVVCYCLMFTAILLFAVKAFRTVLYVRTAKDRLSAERALAVAAAGFITSTSTMYMSSTPMYYIASISCSLILFPLLMAVLAYHSAEI